MSDHVDPVQRPPERSSLADSPFFWLTLFGLAAIAALALIGPKFSQRQGALEMKYEGRLRAWQQPAAPADLATPQDEATVTDEEASGKKPNLVMTLGLPLLALMYLAAAVIWLRARRRRAAKAGEGSPP